MLVLNVQMSSDLSNLEELVSDLSTTTGTAGSLHGGNEAIPIEHLDFAYVKTCSNTLELERILLLLRSGREGLSG